MLLRGISADIRAQRCKHTQTSREGAASQGQQSDIKSAGERRRGGEEKHLTDELNVFASFGRGGRHPFGITDNLPSHYVLTTEASP